MQQLLFISQYQLSVDKFIWCFQQISEDCDLLIKNTTALKSFLIFITLDSKIAKTYIAATIFLYKMGYRWAEQINNDTNKYINEKFKEYKLLIKQLLC